MPSAKRRELRLKYKRNKELLISDLKNCFYEMESAKINFPNNWVIGMILLDYYEQNFDGLCRELKKRNIHNPYLEANQ